MITNFFGIHFMSDFSTELGSCRPIVVEFYTGYNTAGFGRTQE